VLDYWLLGLYPSEQDLALVRYGKASAPVGTPRLASQVPLVADQKTLVLSESGVLSERDIPPAPPAIAALPDAQLEASAQEEGEEDADTPAEGATPRPSPAPKTTATATAAPAKTASPSKPTQATTAAKTAVKVSTTNSVRNSASRP
jgi:penicillin-binding protein 2